MRVRVKRDFSRYRQPEDELWHTRLHEGVEYAVICFEDGHYLGGLPRLRRKGDRVLSSNHGTAEPSLALPEPMHRVPERLAERPLGVVRAGQGGVEGLGRHQH